MICEWTTHSFSLSICKICIWVEYLPILTLIYTCDLLLKNMMFWWKINACDFDLKWKLKGKVCEELGFYMDLNMEIWERYDLRILWKFWFGIRCVLHDLMNSVPLIICEDLFLWNNDLMRWYWIWLRLKIWNGIHGRIFLKTLSMIWYLILLTSGDLTLTGSSSFTKRSAG